MKEQTLPQCFIVRDQIEVDGYACNDAKPKLKKKTLKVDPYFMSFCINIEYYQH